MLLEKFLFTPMQQRLSTIWARKEQVDKWFEGWKLFFILAFARSGTAFTADLLNRAEGAYVFHEPVLEDFYAHLRAHYSLKAAENYMQGFRKKEIFMRMRHISPAVYGEVNGLLRCHAQAIKKQYPQATVLHMVRDGRDVVRSTMPRRTFTYKNPFSMQIHPTESDPWHDKWHQMDRFARICWFWQEENSRLRNAIGKTIQFEKIVSDYDYFHDEILEPCNIKLDRKTWEGVVPNRRNITAEHQMPEWEAWTPAQKKTFVEICGEEMVKCGYPI